MKNDKNIKVDDLFKDLADREEPVAAGAWSRMSSVLDKSLPIGGAVGGDSRYTSYLILALLTLGLGAGAVTWQYTSNQTSIAEAQQASESKQNTAPSKALSNNNLAYNASKPNLSGLGDDEIAATEEHQQTRTEANAPLNPKNTNNKPKGSNNSANAPTAQQQMARTAQKSVAATKEDANIQHNKTNAAVAINPQADLSLNPDQKVNAPSIALASNEKALPENYEKVIRDKSTNELFVKQKEDKKWYKEVEKEGTALYVTKRKSVDETTNKQTIFYDTTRKEKYIRTILQPLSKSEHQRVMLLASAAPIAEARYYEVEALEIKKEEKASNNIELVPLSEFKVKSSEEKKNNFIIRFYDAMSKYINGYKPYYFGLSAGAHSSFNNPSQLGYHFGLSGYYELKERWTLGAEAKMLYQKPIQSRITEDYTTYSNQYDTVVNGATMYAATKQNLNNIYDVSGYWGIALPLTAQYHLGKVSLIAGIEPSYRFAIAHQKQQANVIEPATPVLSQTALLSTGSSINEQDFKSRFGMGYNIGLMYDWTKNLSMDFRINQMLWHNVKGGSQLSNSLHKAPFFNLSLYYFIGRKDKVIYMMDNKGVRTK